MAVKKKAAAATPQETSEEKWDMGVVTFVITNGDGRTSSGSQMCWSRSRYITRMTDRSKASFKEKDKKDRYTFAVVGGAA